MYSIRNFWAVVGVVAIMAVCARAQDADWRTAARDVVNYTADLLEKKIKGDEDALAGLKRAKERLLKDKKLGEVTDQLKDKFKTDKPDPEKLKELRTSIGKQIDKADADMVKKIFKVSFEETKPTVVEKSTDLPWPFGKG